MDLDSFWQLFCKSCFPNENEVGIEAVVIFFRNPVLCPQDEMLDVAVFLVIFSVGL